MVKRTGLNKVPSFLNYLVADEIESSVFFEKFSNKDDIPLWWKRDVPAVLTKKERLLEIKRQRAVNAYLAGQVKEIKKTNDFFNEKRDNEQLKFEERMLENKALVELKLKELELSASENEENLKRELAEQEEKLKAVTREREEREAELLNEANLRKKQLTLLNKLEGVKKKINETAERINQEDEIYSGIKGLYETLRAENEKREELYPELPKGNRAPDAEAEKNADGGEKSGAYVVAKRYEEFSPENVIELKDIYFKRKSETDFVFKGLNLYIKKNKVNVLLSESEEKLALIRQMLFKTYPSDFHIIQGLVRIAGEEAGKVPKSEYKETFGGFMTSMSDVYDVLSRSRLTLKAVYKKEAFEDALRTYCTIFGLPPKIISAGLKKIDYGTLHTLSLTGVLSSGKPVKILESPEESLDKPVLDRLVNYLNTAKLNQSVLITTKSFELTDRIGDAKVFKI